LLCFEQSRRHDPASARVAISHFHFINNPFLLKVARFEIVAT
jgi:hypothetical protein